MSNIYVTIDYYNKEDDVYVLYFTSPISLVATIVLPGLSPMVLKECKTGCLNSISRTVSVPVVSNCLMCSGVGGYFLSTCSSRFIAGLCFVLLNKDYSIFFRRRSQLVNDNRVV